MKKKPLENYGQINRNHKLEKIASAIDQHKTTVGIFLDFFKEFDTLNHQILFPTLEQYGIRDVAL